MLLKKFKFAILISGFLLFFLNVPYVYSQSTQTGSVGIEATIPTNPPTTAATISTPSNGQTFTSLPINVSGTCHGDVLVKLFKNNVFGGSADCSSGSYSIVVDLFNGTNDLVVKVYDALDQAGPDSNNVTVTFTEPSFNREGPRVSLTTLYAKRGANPGEELIWPISVSGGKGPYALSIDWGDGTDDLMSQSLPGNVDLKHVYGSPGAYKIIVKVTDGNGSSAFLQLVGVGNGPLSQDELNAAGGTRTIQQAVIWWPLLAAIILVCVSFWLGRKHQLESLRRENENRVRY